MQQWEYTTVFNCSSAKLGQMGLEGWELVTIRADAFYIFKRPLRTDTQKGAAHEGV